MDTPNEKPTLIVCSWAAWLAEDLKKGTKRTVIHDLLLDAPIPTTNTIWWLPAGHACRLNRSGLNLKFVSPGPHWLQNIPKSLLKRNITTKQYKNLTKNEFPGFVKCAEAKIDGLPAAWYDTLETFQKTAEKAGICKNSWIQSTPTKLNLQEEHRCYILNGKVTTSSPYMKNHTETYEPGWETNPSFKTKEAQKYAETIASQTQGPATYTLDVGLDNQLGWVIIEANPVWCSGTYGANPTQIVNCLEQATKTDPQWQWKPDPYLTKQANKMRLLTPKQTLKN